jgi:hypothetical protein
MPPWERYQQAAPTPAELRGPWERYAKNTEPEALIDYDAPIERLRGEIAKLPEANQKRAYDLWADKRVAKERSLGLGQLPEPARGIPIIGGLLDEATAGIGSVMHDVTGGYVGRPYDEGLALERARQRQAEEANPALAATSQIVTGLATGGPLFSRLAPARTLLGRVGQGVSVAVPLGVTERFTRAEGSPGERVEAAAQGAPMDVAIGAAFPLAGSALTRAVGAAQEYLGPTVTRLRHGAEEAADEILASRIAREGSSPAAKRLDLQRGQAQSAVLQGGGSSASRATLPETIADTSDEMQRLTGSLYRQGGEAGSFIKGELSRRKRGPENAFAERATTGPQGQHERIVDATERALLIKTADTAHRTERQIMADQAREGRTLYNQAYEASETFDLKPAIDAMGLIIQQYPGPVAAKLNRARNLFLQPGVRGNQPFWVDDIRRFDAAKKSLDDMIETAQRQGQNNLARELTGFKDALLRQVHGIDDAGNATRNLAYQEARQTWGTAAENREAIELGRGALREGSEISVEQFRALTRGQQQLFRIGFLESLRNALGTKRPGNDVTQLFQQRRVQDLMGEIVPRSQARRDVFRNRPERYGDVLRREGRMVQTENVALGGSQTAQRQIDDMTYTGDALANMWNRFRSSPSLFNMGVEAIGVGIQKVFGYRQDVALAMAKRLLEQDPTRRNQILRRLERRGGPDRFARFADTVDRASVTMIGTTQPALITDQRR